MKRPKWTDDYLGKRNYTIGEQAAADLAIRSAAKALRIDAKWWRKEKNADAAWAVETVAAFLDQVAAGKTWAEAFDWPAVDGKVK
jgi:hypothetical protein